MTVISVGNVPLLHAYSPPPFRRFRSRRDLLLLISDWQQTVIFLMLSVSTRMMTMQ